MVAFTLCLSAAGILLGGCMTCLTLLSLLIRYGSFRPRPLIFVYLFVCLFVVLRRFQHYTGHITTGSWKGRGNQYIEFARVLYCKLPTNGKQLPAFPLPDMTGIKPQPQRWEARVLPLYHRGPLPRPLNTQLYFCRILSTLLLVDSDITSLMMPRSMHVSNPSTAGESVSTI